MMTDQTTATQIVHGVSVTQVMNRAFYICHDSPLFKDLFILNFDHEGVHITIDDSDLTLDITIDDQMIPGHPYWWWQIDRGDFPLDFGKADMQWQMKRTVRKLIEDLYDHHWRDK